METNNIMCDLKQKGLKQKLTQNIASILSNSPRLIAAKDANNFFCLNEMP